MFCLGFESITLLQQKMLSKHLLESCQTTEMGSMLISVSIDIYSA